MAPFSWFRRSRKTDEETGDAADKDAKDAEKKDTDKTGPSYTDRIAKEAGSKFVDFFGNKPPMTEEEKKKIKEEKAKSNSWRNIAATSFTFVVFIYAFCIQIWIISRSVEASKTDPNSVPINGLGAYTSSYPIGTFTQTRTLLTTDLNGDYTSVVSRVTITRTSSTVRSATNTRVSTQTETSTSLVEATGRAVSSSGNAAAPKATARPKETEEEADEDTAEYDDEVTWLRRRALVDQGPFSNLSTSCIYYNGSELAKRGGVAVALNVFYNVWIMLFIVFLLFFERKRLRLSRKAHSAAVIGLVQLWLATDYISRGVENTLLIAAAGIYICAAINLLYGLPETHINRESLFPYLLERPDRVGPAVRAVQFGAPKDSSQMFTTAKEAAEALDVEPEALPAPDFKPANQPPPALLRPEQAAHLTAKERKAAGADINPEVEKPIPGGLRSTAHLASRGNFQELLREMMLPQKDEDGKPVAGGGGGNRMESIMSAMMMMQLMNSLGGQGGMMGMGGMGMGMGMGMGGPMNPMGGMMGMAPRVGMPGAPMAPPNAYMNPMMPNPGMSYGAPGMYGAPGVYGVPGMPAMPGATTGGDDFLDRYVAKQQAKQAERQMRGWGGGGYM